MSDEGERTDPDAAESGNHEDAPEQLVYHYTDAAGFLGILSTNELWASSLLSVNDQSEISYGLSVVRRVLNGRDDPLSRAALAAVDDERIEKLRRGVFVVSASLDGDSLSQWLRYSGRQGYAIGLQRSPLMVRLDDPTPENANHDPLTLGLQTVRGPNRWPGVVYSEASQERIVLGSIERFSGPDAPQPPAGLDVDNDMIAAVVVGTVLGQFKHPAFREEREVRTLWTGRNPKPEFRVGAYGVLPYVRLAAAHDGEMWSVARSEADAPLPISEVVIGPSDHDERPLIEAATRQLLETRGYGDVKIIHSSAPYRF